MPRQPTHGDAGLQPERTDLAWRRTILSMVVAATIFLRWMPRHGLFAVTLVALSVLMAFALHLTQRRRFRRSIQGVNDEGMAPNVASTASVAATTIILALLGIYIVLFLPFDL